MLNKTNLFIGASAADLAVNVVCGDALLVTVIDQPGSTNELEFSYDLQSWRSFGIQWVLGDGLLHYYVPQLTNQCFYRTREIADSQ